MAATSETRLTKNQLKVKLPELIDVAIGGQERGEINVHVLRIFFNFFVKKLEIHNETAFIDPELTQTLRDSETVVPEPPAIRHGPPKFKIVDEGTPNERKEYLDERVFGLCGSGDLEFSCISIGSVFKALKVLEDSTTSLDDFTDQYNLLRHLNPYEKIYPTILSESWRTLKIIRQVFKNQSDLAGVQISFEMYREKMNQLRAFNDEIRRAVTDLTKDQVDETGRPIFTNPFAAMSQSLGKVNKVIERFPDFEAEFRRINQKVGPGTLPSLAFLDNMSSWCSIEMLTQNNPICYVPFETRKVTGDAPPTKTFMALCLKLAQMIKYNEEKMRRLKAIEVHLEHLKLKNATKKEAQKLIERMAEVDGIGTAVERLLCRTQKCEDMICSMRQVINKVYGCLTSNPATRYESENLWSCIFNQDENTRPENNEGDLISDAQMKTFHSQITKIDCEAKIIERSMMNVEAIKVDVKNLFSIANELEENKLDKCLLSTEISKKADRHSVDDKVTRFCFQQTCEGINTVIGDILTKILENDKECHKVINYLTGKAKLKTDSDSLHSFKEQAENKLRCLAQRLTNMHNYRRNNNNNSNRNRNNALNICNSSNDRPSCVPPHSSAFPSAAQTTRWSVATPVAPSKASKSKTGGGSNNNVSNCNNNDVTDSNSSCSGNSFCSGDFGEGWTPAFDFRSGECADEERGRNGQEGMGVGEELEDEGDERGEPPGLGRFLARLGRRSRGLLEIGRSFKRINDSFRLMTQAMYDFDSFGDFLETFRANNDNNMSDSDVIYDVMDLTNDKEDEDVYSRYDDDSSIIEDVSGRSDDGNKGDYEPLSRASNTSEDVGDRHASPVRKTPIVDAVEVGTESLNWNPDEEEFPDC